MYKGFITLVGKVLYLIIAGSVLSVLDCSRVHKISLPALIRADETNDENKSISSADNENCKKHFIHLYTTSGNNGRPICYMDVYEIFSPMDEKKLRYAASKGIPNKTYLKYNQSKLSDKHGHSQAWMEYSTLTL